MPVADQSLPVHDSPSCSPADHQPDLAEMIDWIATRTPGTGTEALRQLRAAYPDTPLTLRVAALNALIRRKGGNTSYIPR